MEGQLVNDATARGVATRRIRRRARIWREWQTERQHAVSYYVDQLRRWAEPKGEFTFKPRPALTRAQLRAEVEEAMCEIVKNLRAQLCARFREPPHMKDYHREHTIKLIGLLRERPKGREALATVSAELREYDL
jgi:hypothetical protein